MTTTAQSRVSATRHWKRVLAAVGCLISAPVLALFSGAGTWFVVLESEPNRVHLFGMQLIAVAAWVLWIAFWKLTIRTVADVWDCTEAPRAEVWAWTIAALAASVAHASSLAYAMGWTVLPLGSFATWFF